ncbi:MAG: cell division protein SepF [Longispora sp.]|nr:cell division protein SepF [Longispora sp. (in: high G+C Gram-positive bacteria)]
MGAMRKAGVWLGLIEDEDGHYADDEPHFDERRPSSRSRRGYDGYGEHEAEDQPETRTRPEVTVPRPSAEPVSYPRQQSDDDAPRLRAAAAAMESRADRSSVRPLNRGGLATLTQDNLALMPQMQHRERILAVEDDDPTYRIMTLHPTTYNEARTIGERFREGTPVIMNLTEMDEADAKRLVDFAAGLAFGLRGTIERVTNRVFLLSPVNVTVTAEDKAKIAEGGFFQQS